ncbi:30S ribosomal protein S4 [Candidatus Woesebacteria bacterium]|nr:30S ribosomal protein S4 [Candidatus Woesebacteria bacterium]
MARYIGPKNKLARKIGEDLGLRTNPLKVGKRLNVRPGQHGAKSRRKQSDYAIQLKEKQKVKYIYGILEQQLRKLYTEASQRKTATGATLLSYLERRLDNVLYRIGWAPTRAAARQIVNHGHVRVNSKKMSIPSYRVQVNDVISLTDSALHIPTVEALLKDGVSRVEWLERKAHIGKVVRAPLRNDIQEKIEEQLVIEYYSR